MIVKTARFVSSLSQLREFEGQGMPEIAACGKSNVGKSSLINRLGHNKKLARISSEPGKTRLINLYNFDETFMLVDLPGYGFARAPIDEKKKWGAMIEGYLSGSQHLKHVLQLVDIRHEPTKDDQMMVSYLRHYGIEFTVLATKADKLSKAARSRNMPAICRAMGVQPWEVIPFSAEDGTGLDRLLELIEKIVSGQDTRQ
ncbi:ribosome biogenesis GTP-binding protein YihA/YsxC [Eubacteriales bacterium OttesenSCG-928-N13]|nr:ribosome biogenesis GTP-binding protein YihA/YsxC [Eubacteriales bacterium OttesenSCG-928-N13]